MLPVIVAAWATEAAASRTAAQAANESERKEKVMIDAS
jgi:hypothetical protein